MDAAFSSPQRQALLLLYSLILGALLGLIFGIARLPFDLIKHIALIRGKKRVFRFVYDLFFDVLFSLIYTVAVVLFIYASNDGVIRYFMIVSSLSGTLIYHISIGKLFKRFTKTAARPLYNAGVRIYKLIKKLLHPLYAAAENKKVKLYIISKIRTGTVRR